MIVLVGHHKGGVGKSTITVNLAVELQRRGEDVCIVEADPTIFTTSNWARDRAEAGLPPITVVRELGDIRQTLLDLDQRHGYVLVDPAGKDSHELRSALTVADVMVAPMEPSQPELDANKPLMVTVETARNFNPELKVGGVLNRVETHVWDKDEKGAREYMAALVPEMPMCKVHLHQRKAYKRAQEAGRGVVEMRDGKAKAEIQLLLDEVLSW